MFWLVNAILAIGAYMTWTWTASSAGRSGGTPRVVILGRDQTEEWKGWMQVSSALVCVCCCNLDPTGTNSLWYRLQLLLQWAFIFYHYYRVYYVYNEIRVFVSAYVWMVSWWLSRTLTTNSLVMFQAAQSHPPITVSNFTLDWLWKLPLLRQEGRFFHRTICIHVYPHQLLPTSPLLLLDGSA